MTSSDDVGSACLALELDPPKDVGRVCSHSFNVLASDGTSVSFEVSPTLEPRLPQTPLRNLWRSDPLVPEGIGPPSDLDLPNTEMPDERVIFLSLDLEGRMAVSASVALDEVWSTDAWDEEDRDCDDADDEWK